MSVNPPTGDAAPRSLAHLPVPLFAVVMGVGGLGLAWRRAGEVLAIPTPIGEALLALAALAFVTIAAAYLAKLARHPAAVTAEFKHPVRSAFFPAISIGLLILAVAALPYSRPLALGLWWVGTGLHLAFALAILNRWITHNWEINASNPAWFIPVVGNILVPLAGAPLGQTHLSWMFFAVGMVFWIVLFTIVLYRIVFHDQLPQKFIPTLFILLAPPAVGMLAYLSLNGHRLDPVAEGLFGMAAFTALLLATMARQFLAVPFAISWWAYTFPSAAFAVATVSYHDAVGGPVTLAAAWLVLLLATAIIARVFLATLKVTPTGVFLKPEG